MSNFSTHIAVGGITAGIVGGVTYSLTTADIGVANAVVRSSVAMGATLFGSMYPDTDVKSKSSIACNLVLIGLGLYAYFCAQWILLALCVVMTVVPLFTKHGGVVHKSAFNLSIAGALWYLYTVDVGAGFVAGVGSHLLLDRH